MPRKRFVAGGLSARALTMAVALTVSACGTAEPSRDASCARLLECAEALGAGTAALTDEFGDTRACWSRSDAEIAACEQTCRSALDALALPGPEAAECRMVDPRPACDLHATGDDVGAVTADIALEADDRSSVRLHDLCESWIVLYHNVAWLRIEDSRVQATALHHDFATSGVIVLGVLVEDRLRRPAGAAAASVERSDFDLPFRVVADPDATLANRFSDAPAYPGFTLLQPGAVVVERWTTARRVREVLGAR